MPSAPGAQHRLAALAICLSLSPAVARAAPPPGPFAEPPPGEPDGPVEPTPVAELPAESRLAELVEFDFILPGDVPPVKTHPLVLSVFSPLSTNVGEPVETYVELNVFYGRVGALRGVSAGAFSHVDGPAFGLRVGALVNLQTSHHDSGGVWLAGFLNFPHGDMAGLLAAGFGNVSVAFDGVALAGGINVAGGLMQGGQIALVGNFAKELSGLQAAGLFNRTESGSGAQAGAVNVADGGFGGAQAGAFNMALEGFGGAQLGAFNFAHGADDSLQLGAFNGANKLEGGLQLGVVNYARRFERGGLQLGVINVASRGEGTQIGLINASERLVTQPVAWGSWGRGQAYSAGLRLRNGAPYSQLFVTYAPSGGRDRLGPGVALGARVSPEGPVFVDLDAAYTYLTPPRRGDQGEHRPALRASLGLDASEHFGVFVGASGGAQVRGGGARPAFEGFAGLHF